MRSDKPHHIHTLHTVEHDGVPGRICALHEYHIDINKQQHVDVNKQQHFDINEQQHVDINEQQHCRRLLLEGVCV